MSHSPVTYRMQLEALDVEHADFTGQHGVQLSLPRSEWELTGRPSEVSITPVAAHPIGGD